MRRFAPIAFAIVGACSSSSETSPAPTPDASNETGALTCANVADEFAKYAALHSDCTTAVDCTLTGGTGTCDCARTLGSGSGTAIRKDAVAGTHTYFDVFSTCTGPGLELCDAAPAELACEKGQCVARERSCLDSFDTGPLPDTTPLDAPETSTNAALTCDSVQSEFVAYLAAHDSCSSTEECTSIGGGSACDCGRSLGDASGNGIRKDAVAGATKYTDFFYGACDDHKVCDAAPGTVSCSMGHCRVSMNSCLPFPTDGGPD